MTPRSALSFVLLACLIGCTEKVEQPSTPPLDSSVDYVAEGNAYLSEGDLDTAIAKFTAAITLDGKNVDAHIRRGKTYIKKSEHKKAAADFFKVTKLAPANAEAHYELGVAHSRLQRFEASLKAFSQRSTSNRTTSRPMSIVRPSTLPSVNSRKPSRTATWRQGSTPFVIG